MGVRELYTASSVQLHFMYFAQRNSQYFSKISVLINQVKRKLVSRKPCLLEWCHLNSSQYFSAATLEGWSVRPHAVSSPLFNYSDERIAIFIQGPYSFGEVPEQQIPGILGATQALNRIFFWKRIPSLLCLTFPLPVSLSPGFGIPGRTSR